MTAQVQRFQPTDDLADMMQAMEDDGVFIVDNILSQEELDRINADLDPAIEARMTKLQEKIARKGADDIIKGVNQRGMNGLLTHSPDVAKLIHNPILIETCEKFLQPECIHYRLNGTAINEIGPGTPAQSLHRDDGTYPVSQECMFISMWALTDFTKENGATAVVPGSHKWPEARDIRMVDGYSGLSGFKRDPKPEEITYAEMKAGSVAIFLGSTVHGGGHNSTEDEWRRGMYLGYGLGWLIPEENFWLTVPPEEAGKLPPETRRLIGYEGHASKIGYMQIGEKPMETLWDIEG